MKQINQVNIDFKKQFPASKKVYVKGSRPDIRVPMREITLHTTETETGIFHNEPIRVYDTSGPYTDPSFNPDVYKGLPDIYSLTCPIL